MILAVMRANWVIAWVKSKKLRLRPSCSKGGYTTIRCITQLISRALTCWIEIYPMDIPINPMNNWGVNGTRSLASADGVLYQLIYQANLDLLYYPYSTTLSRDNTTSYGLSAFGKKRQEKHCFRTVLHSCDIQNSLHEPHFFFPVKVNQVELKRNIWNQV